MKPSESLKKAERELARWVQEACDVGEALGPYRVQPTAAFRSRAEDIRELVADWQKQREEIDRLKADLAAMHSRVESAHRDGLDKVAMAPPLTEALKITEELCADEPGMVDVTIDVDERLALPVEARKGRVRLRMKLPREACPGALGAPPRKLYLFRSWFSCDCGGGYLEEVLAPDLATAAREALAEIDTDETTSAAVLEVVGMMELDVAGEQRRRVVAKRAAKQAATEAAERAQYEALRAKYEGR